MPFAHSQSFLRLSSLSRAHAFAFQASWNSDTNTHSSHITMASASSPLGARTGETTPATAGLEASSTLASVPIAVPKRILMGPGPSNAHPRVLAAQGEVVVHCERLVPMRQKGRESREAREKEARRLSFFYGHQKEKKRSPTSTSTSSSLRLSNHHPSPPPPRPHAPAIPRDHGRDQAGPVVAVPDLFHGHLPRQRHGARR